MMKSENETEGQPQVGSDAWLSELRGKLEFIQDRYTSTILPETGLPPPARLNPFAWQSKAAAMADDIKLLLEWLPSATRSANPQGGKRLSNENQAANDMNNTLTCAYCGHEYP